MPFNLKPNNANCYRNFIQDFHQFFVSNKWSPVKEVRIGFLGFVSVAESLYKVVEKLLQALGSMDAHWLSQIIFIVLLISEFNERPNQKKNP